jgi:hypothetical protein
MQHSTPLSFRSHSPSSLELAIAIHRGYGTPEKLIPTTKIRPEVSSGQIPIKVPCSPQYHHTCDGIWLSALNTIMSSTPLYKLSASQVAELTRTGQITVEE